MMMKRRGFWCLAGALAVLAVAPASAQAQRDHDRPDRPAGASGASQRFQFTQPRALQDRGFAAKGFQDQADPGFGERAVERSGRATQVRGREVSDQDHAQRRRETGELMSLRDLMRSAQRAGRGEYLGVEPNVSSNRYRFKYLRPGNAVVWVDVDARTGEVLSVRE